jgi:hypothetical protein
MQVMVEIIHDYWGRYLVSVPDEFSDETPLPTLESLRNKILIKVKYTPPDKAAAKQSEKALSKTRSNEESSEDETQGEQVKKGKIIESLGKLGVYTRSCHFQNFGQREATLPTHVFALSEGKLLDLPLGLVFKHNLNYLMRAYPKGTRVRSTNLDPAPFWRQGIQMVALNWQQLNAAMMLNDAMFSGSGGWVLKPDGYREVNGSLPKLKRCNVDLKIEILAAQSIGPSSKTPNAFVKVELHVGDPDVESGSTPIPKGGQNKGGEWKRKSAVHHSRDPDFGSETLDFTGVAGVVPELSFVRYVEFSSIVVV